MTPEQLGLLALQVAVIVATARLAGWIFRRVLGQPAVVGEMVAGVLLGPSLFGLLAPDLQAALFTPDTREPLRTLGQLGVGLYMVLVGLAFDRGELRRQAAGAGAVCLAGMAAPFLAAAALTPWLIGVPGLFGPGVGPGAAGLFLGACIAITAFPVLARILDERGLSGSPLGALTLSAGAIGDAAAWVVLALVLATLAGGGGASGAFDLGLYAVLGGFLLGVAIPRGPAAARLRRVLEPLTVLLLVPLFFAVSGLSTRLDLIADPALALPALAVLFASILAKGGACWAAARLTGQDNRTALGIGVLMNARGLMELVILNIGLRAGLIGPALFSILVLMAIVTTLMTSPLFEALYGRRARARGELGVLEAEATPLPHTSRP